MSEYRLHGFAESGNSCKPAWYLTMVGADWEPVVVDLFNGATFDPAWRASTNVMGEVPVLDHGEKRLSQSGVILDYLVERFGAFGWENDDQRRDVLRWILFDNHKFTGNLATARFLKHFRRKDDDVTRFYENRVDNALDVLEAHLASNDWLALGRPTIADISMSGYVFFDGETHIDWSKHPATDAWRGRVAALDKWRHPYDLLPRLVEPAAAS